MKKIFVLLLAALLCLSPLAYSKESDERFVATLMYHNILNSRKGVYIVSEKQLDADLTALEKRGWSFVSAEEVVAFALGQGNLPKKPLLLTFDDGHFNNLFYGLPILKKHNAKAVFNVIGAFSEYSSTSGDSANPNYSHLTWSEIETLRDSGIVEIGNHSFGMHKYSPRFGVGKKNGESDEAYRKAFRQDTLKLQKTLADNCGVMPFVYAFPFGKYCDEANDELEKMGFLMTLSCTEGVSSVKKGDKRSLLLMKRINRDGTKSTTQILKCIDNYLEKASAKKK